MRIVQADTSRLDEVTPLFIKYREFYGHLPKPEASRRFLEDRLKNEQAVILVAEDEDSGKVLGFCQFIPSFSALTLSASWVLKGIYVVEEARRQLVADNMLNQAKVMARAEGIQRMTVMTGETNTTAHSLYRSLGFVDDAEFHYFSLKL
ncbi:GNAT family N-acetyltransferase [Halopseudomonas laoshanensis]|uniref:GNAT family N-acetyltransferase n=1 Tax=Halopseudomonas laoshanensis TaxID=2268758 RepID=A0A7V7KVB3_9GAMM|nr:GNAT family N-acetyltransferase [Halopseudomonas laoshanensis]KAA0694815.1 GNAT family N-acetyltransferase [Halopseudomonas laoshanensis]WOD12281.1 GNAT family N-acetyltransferase [Pseudomonas sp. NyZ704]